MEATRSEALTVLDASSVVAFLRDEPSRARVEELLRERPAPAISAINVAEVVDVLIRVGGHPEQKVNDAIDLLIIGGLEVEPFWLPHARLAASIRAAHYHRQRSAMSLADACCLATALSLKSPVATLDEGLADAARELGVTVIELSRT